MPSTTLPPPPPAPRRVPPPPPPTTYPTHRSPRVLVSAGAEAEWRNAALAKQAQLLSERARRDAVKIERAAAHARKLAARAHVRRLYEIRRAHEASARGQPLVRRPRSASPEKRLELLRDRRAALQNDLRTLPTRYDDEITGNDAEREKVAARLREVRAANNAAAGGDSADDAPLFCDEWALHRLRQAEVALEAHREAVSLAEVFEGWMRGALAPWSEWLPASAAAAAQPPSPEGGLYVRGDARRDQPPA